MNFFTRLSKPGTAGRSGDLLAGYTLLYSGLVIHPLVGVALFALGVFALLVIMSAAKVIFVSAVYHNINGDPVKHFNQQLADNLFIEK